MKAGLKAGMGSGVGLWPREAFLAEGDWRLPSLGEAPDFRELARPGRGSERVKHLVRQLMLVDSGCLIRPSMVPADSVIADSRAPLFPAIHSFALSSP